MVAYNKKNLTLFFLSFSLFPFQVKASSIDWPTSPMGTNLSATSSDLTVLINYFYDWGVSLGGILVFVILLFSGFKYMTSAGNPGAIKEARQKMTSAIIGLVLLLSSWLILSTINPQIVDPDKSLEGVMSRLNLDGLRFFDSGEPPCDLVVFWDEKDYRGNNKTVVNFEIEEARLGERITRHRLTEKIDGVRPASVKSFIKINGEDSAGRQRYNAQGERDEQGQYIEGGNCSLDLFYSSSSGHLWWATNTECAKRAGQATFPSSDVTLASYGETVRCVEIIRSVPEYTVIYDERCSPLAQHILEGESTAVPSCPKEPNRDELESFERVAPNALIEYQQELIDGGIEITENILNKETGVVLNVTVSQTIKSNWKAWECGMDFIDTRDKKIYPTKKIGNTCWISKNMDYRIGGSHARCYSNNSAHCDNYGVLYKQWQAVKEACPSGWRIAVASDYAAAPTWQWAPQFGGRYDGSANWGLGQWRQIGEFGFYWTSTRTGVPNASTIKVHPPTSWDSYIQIDSFNANNDSMYSVRCVKGICDPSWCRTPHGSNDPCCQ